MRAIRSSQALALLAAGLLACAPAPTQLVVVVDTDLPIPSGLDDVSVTVTAPGMGTMASEHQALTSSAPLPLTLAVVPSGDFLGPIDVVAEGSHLGALVVSRRARVTLVRGETRMLRLDLVASCVGASCAATESCGPEGCERIEVSELEPWPGAPPRLFDAGAPVRDAGADAPREDIGPVDAHTPDVGPVDAFVEIPDASGPDAWVGCTTSEMCDDAVACTLDACTDGRCTHVPMDSMCDDGEPCTDDRCTAMGCSTTNNTADCNDRVFCNGFDRCDGGTCSVHTGDPCASPTVCDESVDRCRGCLTRADCPMDSTGTWSACGYADACSESAMRTRTNRTYACTDGACVPNDVVESDPCTRDTDGTSCGAGSCGAWGACDYADTCDESATQRRTCTDLTCTAGTCASSPRTETMACSRTTTGTMCGATSCGAWGACGYSDSCDESATQSRTCTDRACAAGSCGTSMRGETQACTRSTTGTMCGATTCGAWGACDYTGTCDQSATRSRTCTDRSCAGASCGMAMRSENEACTRSTDGTSCGAGQVCMGGACTVCAPTLSGGFGTAGTTYVKSVTGSGAALTFVSGSTGMPSGMVTSSRGTFSGGGMLPICAWRVEGLGSTLRFTDWDGTTRVDVTLSGITVSGSAGPACTPTPYGCFPPCIETISVSGSTLNVNYGASGSAALTFGCP
jgi:hypothetical protein